MEEISKILEFISDSGDGYGSGSGFGYGFGSKINKYKGYIVFYVDKVPTIFDKIKGNVAHCQIINRADMSSKKCYLIKGNGYFAHGNNLEEAREALREKIFANLDTEGRIKEFIKQFNNKDVYSANDFFNWHNLLTGSCLAGRQNFIESHNIDMNKKYTVKEFISICENNYGSDVIKQLKKYFI